MAAEFVQDYETFDLGDFTLQHGDTLQDAKLAYKTFGELNPTRNAIVYPTWYSGSTRSTAGRRGHLATGRTRSSSRTWPGTGSRARRTTGRPRGRGDLPRHVYDRRAHKLVAEHFGIETLPLVTGWSMGAGQTYQWAVSHPDMVQRAAPFCGSSKTSEHNFVFLEGVKAALTGGDSFKGGFYDTKPEDNLRRTGRVYAGWGFSRPSWDRVYTDMGHSYRLGIDLAFPTLEDFLVQYWEGHFLDRRDVNDLLSMLWTWQYGDIGQTPGFDGDHVKALQSIKAKLIAMPALKDLYFPPEDEEYASQYIPNGEVRVIPGVWGHFAGSGDCAVDRKWIDDVIKELLAS